MNFLGDYFSIKRAQRRQFFAIYKREIGIFLPKPTPNHKNPNALNKVAPPGTASGAAGVQAADKLGRQDAQFLWQW